MKRLVIICSLASAMVSTRANTAEAQIPKPDPARDEAAYEQAAAGAWQEIFSDPCTGDWRKQWFLDGEVGTVRTGPEGMTLTAGPEFKNDAHHMVLWTKQSFEGDLKIEYDYTRTDKETRYVNILYIQATGSGKGPYFHFRNPRLPVVTDGRVGLRHMFTRSARYRDFRISTLQAIPNERPSVKPATNDL